MLKSVTVKGGQIKLCGTCREARGLKSLPLAGGVETGTISQLAKWTVESDRVLVF